MPLLADLADPSPGLGWASASDASLLERIETRTSSSRSRSCTISPSARNVPLPMIAALFARLDDARSSWSGCPGRTPMVRRAARLSRGHLRRLHEDGFEAAFAPHFETVDRTPIEGSVRTLYHFRRRDGKPARAAVAVA